jgi:DNA-binding sugar fermentation-stimulating protein
LKTYIPDGDINLTASGSLSSDENLVPEIHDILLSEDQRKDSEFEVKDVQLINAQVLSLPYCYLL